MRLQCARATGVDASTSAAVGGLGGKAAIYSSIIKPKMEASQAITTTGVTATVQSASKMRQRRR